jgi:DNA-binding NarL/FixJ family response regulator
MTVKVLIVDPDISFTVPIKRALEISGDYKVNVFASGNAALELLQRDSHDVAILDVNIDDIELPALIEAMRRIQPWLFVLASPHNPEQTEQLSKLDIQATIPKPYFARQLGPVIRAAAAARARYSKKPSGRDQELTQLPDLKEDRPGEPQIQPDDTFRRAVDRVQYGDTSQMRPVQPESAILEEPPVPENSTVRELVSGQTAPSAATAPVNQSSPAVAPTSIPEPPAPDLAGVAEVALEIADDDTVPLDELPQTLAERVESLPPEDRPVVLPLWVPGESPDQPTLVEPAFTPDDTRRAARAGKSDKPLPPMLDEPAFVAEIFDEALPGTPEPSPEPQPEALPESRPKLNLDAVFASGLKADQDEELEAETGESANPELDHEIAMSFASLLTADEPPEEPPSGLDEPSGVQTALAILGVESVGELEKMPDETPETGHAAPQIDPVAAMALQLTQLTVESAAQVSVLSRDGTLVAMAGLLPDRDIKALLEEVSRAWQDRERGQNAAIFRYIQLPGGSDFLMYSTPTVESMILTTLFPGDIPLKQIRRQSRQLREVLEKIPEPSESPAAITQLSRPTDLRPPEGLRDTATEPAPDVAPSAEPPAESTAAPETMRPEEPYASYAFVWLPAQEPLTPELAGMVLNWLHGIAGEHFWDIEGAEIQPSYVMVQIGVPASQTPSATVELLKRETAARAQRETLWADAYYVITPGRAVTQQEIGNFIAYQGGAA